MCSEIGKYTAGGSSGSSPGTVRRYEIAELRAEFGESSTDESSGTEVLVVGHVRSIAREGGIVRVEVADHTGYITAWLGHNTILSRDVHRFSLIGMRGRLFRLSDLHILANTILVVL